MCEIETERGRSRFRADKYRDGESEHKTVNGSMSAWVRERERERESERL